MAAAARPTGYSAASTSGTDARSWSSGADRDGTVAVTTPPSTWRSAEEIDTVMRLGASHPMGPLALADLIGLDVCLHIMEVLHADFGDDKYRPAPLLRKMVAAGRLGRKSGQGFHSYE